MDRALIGLGQPCNQLAKPINSAQLDATRQRLKGAATTGPQRVSFAPASGANLTDQYLGAAGAAGAVIFLCM